MHERTTSSQSIDYIRDLFAPEDATLKHVIRTIEENDLRTIQIGPDEGKMLEFIIKLANVKTVVELGTLAGYSTLWMARAIPEGGHVYTVEHSPEVATIAQENFDKAGVNNKITLLHGDADKMLPELEGNAPFDMIFIDADKVGYYDYLLWAEKNIKKGGIIVGDNTFLFGAVYQDLDKVENVSKQAQDAMRKFNRRLADPTLYNSIMIPTAEGLTVAQKLF